jgi:hypothetical protein
MSNQLSCHAIICNAYIPAKVTLANQHPCPLPQRFTIHVPAASSAPVKESPNSVSSRHAQPFDSPRCLTKEECRQVYFGAACRRLQMALCTGQSSFWHAFPQYLTDLQAVHSSSLLFASISEVAPQCAHARTLPPPRRAGLLATRVDPSPGNTGSATLDGSASSGLPRESALVLWRPPCPC